MEHGHPVSTPKQSKFQKICHEIGRRGLEFTRGLAQAKTLEQRQKTRQAEQALLESWNERWEDEGQSSQNMNSVHGWLYKLNGGGDPYQEGHWRERLCVCKDGAWSYVSEKSAGGMVKMFEVVNCRQLMRASYPHAGREHAFELFFLDDSSITFAAETEEECARWMRVVEQHLQQQRLAIQISSGRMGSFGYPRSVSSEESVMGEEEVERWQRFEAGMSDAAPEELPATTATTQRPDEEVIIPLFRSLDESTPGRIATVTATESRWKQSASDSLMTQANASSPPAPPISITPGVSTRGA